MPGKCDSRTDWHLRVLGRFALYRGATEITVGTGGRRLLAYVAVNDGSVDRAGAASALWPTAPAPRAGGNLRGVVHRTRRLIGDRLLADRSNLALHPDVTVDLWTCTALAEAITAGAIAEPADAEPADDHLLVTAGDLLPDQEEDWIIMARERFLLLRVRALEHLCRRRTREHRPAEAVAAGKAAARLDPFRESVHRALMAAHLSDGDIASALRLYRCFRTRMCEELDLRAPSDLEAWEHSVITTH
ncbi:BTAD domain-containing putative transcriptional regulator [Actinoplanes sp. NPDC023936]|uniref:AfsR/SARP family transcriptional regulator n=1 Tax=Actinoplanes sp. NPDC023936 TaxID=3154910 RepID=UPI0033F5ACFB